MYVWAKVLSKQEISVFIDNQAVVTILNKKSSKSHIIILGLVMKLVSAENSIANGLFRCNFQRIAELAPLAEADPDPIPGQLWKIKPKELLICLMDLSYFSTILLTCLICHLPLHPFRYR